MVREVSDCKSAWEEAGASSRVARVHSQAPSKCSKCSGSQAPAGAPCVPTPRVHAPSPYAPSRVPRDPASTRPPACVAFPASRPSPRVPHLASPAFPTSRPVSPTSRPASLAPLPSPRPLAFSAFPRPLTFPASPRTLPTRVTRSPRPPSRVLAFPAARRVPTPPRPFAFPAPPLATTSSLTAHPPFLAFMLPPARPV
ncbi:hypothetical protein BOTBODRAFT_182522 [Botryobasidium botryosum FD-172 SS1]|uniref:Uncharacterized protein n=1 Tax=Botryobasidium botryosum (strain FD-172 SS1) TaxID=930990 RepID=A0A067LR79_BOTB1|nr:hypothetical protein BOTBODRAFT_182522 [Botryobasidium botryosum FD-172 SS1]